MPDTTYQPKVYRKQGGDQLVGADGGSFLLEDGFSFFFDDVEVAQENMKALMEGVGQVLTIGQGATSTVLSVSLLTLGYHFIRLSMTSTMVNASCWLPNDPIAGQRLRVILVPGSCISGVVTVYASGVSLVTFQGADNSKFILYNSSNSRGMIMLECISDGEWSVMQVSSEASVTFT